VVLTGQIIRPGEVDSTFDIFHPHPISDLLIAICAARGHLYGWKSSYLAAARPGLDNIIAVTERQLHTWQKIGHVPAYSVNQVPRMQFKAQTHRGRQRWTAGEYDFLRNLYIKTDGHVKNADLANKCAAAFGRDVTENAIKGALDRLRKNGAIHQFRNGNQIMVG
jgi:hypothetical protein